MISAEAGGEGTQKPDENSECDSDNGEEPYIKLRGRHIQMDP